MARQDNRDKSVGENLYTENIEAPSTNRYYPDDMSTQIEIHRQNKAALGEIPKTAALIIASIDDGLMSTWADREGTRIRLEANQRGLDYEDRKNALEKEKNNAIYEETIKYNSRREELIRQARLNNSKESDAQRQVDEEFRMPATFVGAPAYEQAWQNMFSELSVNGTRAAEANDIKTIDHQTKFNIGHLSSVMATDVRNGNVNWNESMLTNQAQIQRLLETLPVEERPALYNKIFNEQVLANVQWVDYALKNGLMDPENAINTLKSLRVDTKDVPFYFTDAKTGERLKYADGSDQVLYGFLEDNIAVALDNVLGAAGKAKQKGTGSAAKILEGLHIKYDFDNWSAGNKCDLMKGVTVADIAGTYVNALTMIPATADTPEKQEEYFGKIVEESAKAIGYVSINEAVRHAGVQPCYDSLQELKQKLIRGDKEDWVNYSFKLSDGTDICGKISDKFLLGDPNLSAYNWWKNFAVQADKQLGIVSEGGDSAVLDMTSIDFSQYRAEADSYIPTSQSLIRGANGQLELNIESQGKLANALASMRKVGAIEGKPNTDLSDVFKTQFDTINKFSTDYEKFMGTRFVVGAALQSNTVGSIQTYLKKNPDNKELVGTALLMEYGNLYGATDVTRKIEDVYRAGNLSEKMEAAKTLMSTQGVDAKAMARYVDKVYTDLGIRPDDRIFDGAFEVINALDITSGTNKGTKGGMAYKVDKDDDFYRLVSSAFVTDKNGLNDFNFVHNVPKYSPALRHYRNAQGKIDTSLLKRDMKVFKEAVNTECSRLNIPSVSSGIRFGASDDLGQIAMFNPNGEPLTTRVKGTGLWANAGVLYFDGQNNFDIEQMAKVSARGGIYNMLLTNEPLFDRATATLKKHEGISDRTKLSVLARSYSNPQSYNRAVKQYQDRHNKEVQSYINPSRVDTQPKGTKAKLKKAFNTYLTVESRSIEQRIGGVEGL